MLCLKATFHHSFWDSLSAKCRPLCQRLWCTPLSRYIFHLWIWYYIKQSFVNCQEEILSPQITFAYRPCRLWFPYQTSPYHRLNLTAMFFIRFIIIDPDKRNSYRIFLYHLHIILILNLFDRRIRCFCILYPCADHQNPYIFLTLYQSQLMSNNLKISGGAWIPQRISDYRHDKIL